MLVGRRAERERLDRLIAAVRGGESNALVVVGEAGIGKTALLEYAAGAAQGFRVVRAVGVESEMELPFAALHQLCSPLLERLDRLPDPQREALETAFGLTVGSNPDRFLLGLAVLGVLSHAGSERSLLCVIDDAQWLDRASAQALAFVARRVSAESVGLVFATREVDADLARLERLTLGGLGAGEAHQLLRSVSRVPLDEAVRERIVAETRGNPLALSELALEPAELASGFAPSKASQLPVRLQQSFRRRLSAAPAEAQLLMLLAAAEPLGDPLVLWRAADRLQIARSAAPAAEQTGLIEFGTRVRFRHPLMRSAVYQAASPEQTREAHRALAEAIDTGVDPDRRAWHLAAVAAGPDEHVAAELERAAGRARARGGWAAAGALLERAAALSVEPSRRTERALAAAQALYQAGALDDALGLMAVVEAGPVDQLQSGRADLLRGQIAFAARRGRDAPALLLRAARQLETVDVLLARDTYVEAIRAAVLAAHLAEGVGVVEVSEAALAGSPASDPPRPTDLLLDGLATRFTQGYAGAAPILKRALTAFQETVPPELQAAWLWNGAILAGELWDDESWTLLSSEALEQARAAGALSALTTLLPLRTLVHVMSGEVAAAASLVEESRAVSDATGIATAPYGALMLAALQGRQAELSQLIESTIRDASARGEGLLITTCEHARASLDNALGHHTEALAASRQAVEHFHVLGGPSGPLPEMIEAAVRCGELHLAASAVERLAEQAAACGTSWAQGVEARCRALLHDGEVAEGLYRDAIERLGRTRIRVDLARAHLVYGEWLRRQRRRGDARDQLREALTMFTAMGAEAWAARTERALVATGEHARKRTSETRDDLTPQERQIARLAREGLSNPEIGARLFISPHTVNYHLRKIFSKLAITSRRDLDAALAHEPDTSIA
jgi:DNA-binding CsgD family transcriptional regulator